MALSPSEIIEFRNTSLFSSPFLQRYIDVATDQTNAAYFGVNYNLAIALRAMHMYVLDQRPNSEAGMISSKREGDLSTSYSSNKIGNGDYLSQSSFGLELQRLINSSKASISVLGAKASFYTL